MAYFSVRCIWEMGWEKEGKEEDQSENENLIMSEL